MDLTETVTIIAAIATIFSSGIVGIMVLIKVHKPKELKILRNRTAERAQKKELGRFGKIFHNSRY